MKKLSTLSLRHLRSRAASAVMAATFLVAYVLATAWMPLSSSKVYADTGSRYGQDQTGNRDGGTGEAQNNRGNQGQGGQSNQGGDNQGQGNGQGQNSQNQGGQGQGQGNQNNGNQGNQGGQNGGNQGQGNNGQQGGQNGNQGNGQGQGGQNNGNQGSQGGQNNQGGNNQGNSGQGNNHQDEDDEDDDEECRDDRGSNGVRSSGSQANGWQQNRDDCNDNEDDEDEECRDRENNSFIGVQNGANNRGGNNHENCDDDNNHDDDDDECRDRDGGWMHESRGGNDGKNKGGHHGNKDCDDDNNGGDVTFVTPIDPTVVVVCGPNNDKVTLPSVTGLTYTSTNWVDGKLTVTATPNQGYALLQGAEKTWSFTDANTSCGEVLGETTTTPTVTPVLAVTTQQLADTGTNSMFMTLISSGILGAAILTVMQQTKRSNKVARSVRRLVNETARAIAAPFALPTA